MIEHNVNGALVEADTPEAWGSAILELLGDTPRRTALGEQARETAAAYYLDAVAPAYLSLFNEVITSYQTQPAHERA